MIAPSFIYDCASAMARNLADENLINAIYGTFVFTTVVTTVVTLREFANDFFFPQTYLLNANLSINLHVWQLLQSIISSAIIGAG